MADEKRDDLAATDAYLDDYRRGKIEPAPVVTPELPDTVQGRNARPVLDDFIHVYAVRLGAADSRPVMYSCRWAAKRIGVSPKTVHRMLAYLVEVGALMPHGAMPGRGTRGTGLFLPSTGAAGGG